MFKIKLAYIIALGAAALTYKVLGYELAIVVAIIAFIFIYAFFRNIDATQNKNWEREVKVNYLKERGARFHLTPEELEYLKQRDGVNE